MDLERFQDRETSGKKRPDGRKKKTHVEKVSFSLKVRSHTPIRESSGTAGGGGGHRRGTRLSWRDSSTGSTGKGIGVGLPKDLSCIRGNTGGGG